MSFDTHSDATSSDAMHLPRPPSNHSDVPRPQYPQNFRSFDDSDDDEIDEDRQRLIRTQNPSSSGFQPSREMRRENRQRAHGNPNSINNDFSTSSHDVITQDFDETSPLLTHPSLNCPPSPSLSQKSSLGLHMRVYRRRWYVLALYSTFAFAQGALGGVWAVIAGSVEATFGWTDADISLMQTWIYLSYMYLVAMFPFAWLMEKKGADRAVLCCYRKMLF